MASILTTASATYAAQTLRGTTKTDVVARADAEVSTYCTGDWANDVDADLEDINEWFAGTTSAGISGNTSTLLGGLTVAEALTVGTTDIVSVLNTNVTIMNEARFTGAAMYPINDGGLALGLTNQTIEKIYLKDGITAPATPTTGAVLYVDTSDGDLKVKFSDGFTAVVAADS